MQELLQPHVPLKKKLRSPQGEPDFPGGIKKQPLFPASPCSNKGAIHSPEPWQSHDPSVALSVRKGIWRFSHLCFPSEPLQLSRSTQMIENIRSGELDLTLYVEKVQEQRSLRSKFRSCHPSTNDRGPVSTSSRD